LRKITEGRSARSQALLVYGTSWRIAPHRAEQLAPRIDVRHWPGQKPVQSPVQVGVVSGQRRVRQPLAPLADRHGPQQQQAKPWRELGVTRLDGILRIAQ